MSVKEISSSNPSGSMHGPNVTAANRKTSPVVRTAPSSNPDRNPLTISLNQATSPKEVDLTEDQIIEAAKEFYDIHGSLPTIRSKEEVPGIRHATWSGINRAARKKGRTLSKILEPLRKELGIVSGQDKDDLTEKKIIEAARKFYKIHGSLPTSKNTDKGAVPGMPNETWTGIDKAGLNGGRGLNKGRTLSEILKPLRQELFGLTEKKIIEAAKEFYKIHGSLPTSKNTDKGAVPGMPHTTWKAIDQAGYNGKNGLDKGRTLSKILKPLKKELYGLTEKKIIKMAKEFYKIYGSLPTRESKEDVPGMPHTTWKAIDAAGHRGKNGLDKGRTLFQILKPLKEKLDGIKLTRKGIPKIFKNANTVRSLKTKNRSSTKEVYSSLSIDKSRNVNFLKGEAFEQAVGLLLLSHSPEERVIPQYCIKVDPDNKYYGMRADYKVGEYYYEVKWGGATDNINETAEKHKEALGENQVNYRMILLNANDGVRRHEYALFSDLNNTVRTSEQLTNLVDYIEELTEAQKALELEQLRDYLYGLVMKANTLKSEERLDFIAKELRDYFSASDKAQYVSAHLYSLYSPLEAYFDYNGSLCRGLITPKALIEENPEGYGLNYALNDISFEDFRDLDLAVKIEMSSFSDGPKRIEDLLEDNDRKHYDKVIFKLPNGPNGITISNHSDLNPDILLENADHVREILNFEEDDYEFAKQFLSEI